MDAQQKTDKFGLDYCTTDLELLLDDDAIAAIFIATRHSTHAELATRSLNVGKHVFVEKPMMVPPHQLETLRGAYEDAQSRQSSGPTGLMVELNRRFAPMVQELRNAFPTGRPKQILYRVNGCPIDTDSWLHRDEEGGGILVGEMIHLIDLMQYLSGEQPEQVYAQSLALGRHDHAAHDNLTVP